MNDLDGICPVCGSFDIESEVNDGGDGFIREGCGCNECKSSWYNHYKLVDQEIVVNKGVRCI